MKAPRSSTAPGETGMQDRRMITFFSGFLPARAVPTATVTGIPSIFVRDVVFFMVSPNHLAKDSPFRGE